MNGDMQNIDVDCGRHTGADSSSTIYSDILLSLPFSPTQMESQNLKRGHVTKAFGVKSFFPKEKQQRYFTQIYNYNYSNDEVP